MKLSTTLTVRLPFVIQAFLLGGACAGSAGLPLPILCLDPASACHLSPTRFPGSSVYLPIHISVAQRSVTSQLPEAIKPELQCSWISGHGEMNLSTTLTVRLPFVIQVSYSHSSVKSSNRFLIVVPCPGTLLHIYAK